VTFTPEFLLQIVVAAGAAFTTYAAIRADLARLHERTSTTKQVADKAHERIDELANNLNHGRRNHE
jgi:hypothetical protein